MLNSTITVTKGAIDNNYLTITKQLNEGMIPKEQVNILIRTPIGEFSTLVLPELGRLQERSFVRRLYSELNLKPGSILNMRVIERNRIYEISI